MPVIPSGQFRFKILGEIGKGGLGRVDKIEITISNCIHPVGSVWARKRMNENWTPVHLTRFEREITAVKSMKHSAIVTCAGENLPGGERFYVMPCYPDTLRHRLSRAARFPWLDVAAFGATIADALQYAHNAGRIHRDVKPENILLTSDGRPVISDWGLGYFIHKESKVLQALTRGGMGTEYYCSAEQWSTGKCGATGDVYSLGMVLAELVEGSQRAIPAPGWGIDSDVVDRSVPGAAEFNALISRMTAAVATRRVQTMREVGSELRRCHAIGSLLASK